MKRHRCFSLPSQNSKGMMSDKPTAGYETETARTIDVSGGNPSCYQGGVVVLAAIEGNGSRPSHRGGGINDGKKMYTLNTTEVHGVIYELPKDNRPVDGK